MKSSANPDIVHVAEQIERKDRFVTRKEGLKKAAESGFIFIGELPILKHRAGEDPCDVRLLGKPFNRQAYGFAFPKESPYYEAVSETLLQLLEEGIFDVLEAKW